MPAFVDTVTVHVKGGDGGNGCASIKREKFKPLAGPDGANGGRGGNVELVVDPQVTTLLSYHHQPHRRAGDGGFGKGDFRAGTQGDDLILPVPDGTVVKSRSGEVIADLVGAGARLRVAEGGHGGLGNAALASTKRKAPGFALLGEPGEEHTVVLELKTVADVALVGFPSSGKSSLIAALSAARPKIADYPFTTLTPNLGVVQAGEMRYTIADVPGLIPGASQGKGLGLDFLRHIERCHVIAHVLDTAALESERNPVDDLDALEHELGEYAAGLDVPDGMTPLMERPRLVVLNKVDVPDGREMAEMMRGDLEARGYPVFEVSAATHEGLRSLSFALGTAVDAARAALPEPTAAPTVLRPEGVGGTPFTVTPEWDGDERVFRVRGAKPERWVRQTAFNNDEAVGYLADRLATAGVEDALLKAGAVAGSTVVIGAGDDAVVFDWEPTMAAGAELLGPRGTDVRLEDHHRPTRDEKRSEQRRRTAERMDRLEAMEAERRAGHWTDPGA